MTMTTSTQPGAADVGTLFPSIAALRDEHSALLRKTRNTDGVLEAGVEIKRFIERGRATGAIIDRDPDRWDVQGLLDYWSAILYRANLVPPDATLADYDSSMAPNIPDEMCPFVGLDAFREERRPVFFGRSQLVDELLSRLAAARFLAVLGPSGSGKSSLVMAGLLPALRSGAIDGSREWDYIRPFVPGPHPLTTLVETVMPEAPLERQQAAAKRLETDPLGLPALISERTEKPALIVVDQFEETFTLCASDSERAAFIAAVLAAKAEHRVVLTMRSDYETFIARVPDLQAAFEASQVRVTPLSASDLREAIERPAAAVGLRFEDGVVDSLVRDILGEPAGLPLLQFTLMKLWEMRDHDRITRAAYRRLGGARAALAHSADECYERMIPEDQALAKRILLRLVRPGESLEIVSNRVPISTLVRLGPRERVERVLGTLVHARLVRLTSRPREGDDQIEVAHEALVRNWPTLVGWLEDERGRLRQRQRLSAAAELWMSHGKDEGGLLGGSLLDEARRYDDLSDLEAEFVKASLSALDAARQREVERILREKELERAVEERRRIEEQKRVRLLSIFSVLLAAAVLLAGTGWYRATKKTEEAQEKTQELTNTMQELTKTTEELKSAQNELKKLSAAQIEAAKEESEEAQRERSAVSEIHELVNQARVYENGGALEDAAGIYKRLIQKYEQRGEFPNQATALVSLGNVYRKLGDSHHDDQYFKRALEAYKKARTIRANDSKIKKVDVAVVDYDIALVYGAMKEYAMAERAYASAFEIWRREKVTSHNEVYRDATRDRAEMRSERRGAAAPSQTP
jgi:tetratricopeptide (TPR) repeat protein